MKQYTRICAKVDLSAIIQNIQKMYENLEAGSKIAAVIKADGYGHGAVPIAETLKDLEYIWGFAVATLDEAVVLRRSGVTKPLLVLGCIFPDQYQEILDYDLQVTIYSQEAAESISRLAVSCGKTVKVHIKLDTGMGRIGFLVSDDSVSQIEAIKSLPGIEMTGLYTHFAKADEKDKTDTNRQFSGYMWMKEELKKKGISFSYYHCSNSAAIIDMKKTHIDLVRAGIATYGLYPSGEVMKENVPLIPALSLISHVAHVKWVDEGCSISYGGTFSAKRRTKVATIPVGYGDGYPRSLSNKGHVLIRGKEAPILGRICMDQFMVDVTEIEEVRFGDQVTLIGRDGKKELSVEVLSELSGRFNYEFVCDLGKRIPREYILDGQVISQTDYFA